MTDKDLRRDVLDELDFDPSLDAAEVGVAVSEGVVTLAGHAGSYAEQVAAERDAAERAAWSVPGVRAVEDRTVAMTWGGSHGPSDGTWNAGASNAGTRKAGT